MEVSVGKLTGLRNKLGSASVDLFIGSASFEGRCRSVLQDMEQERIESALVAVNGTFGAWLGKHYEWFVSVLGTRTQRLDVFSHNPVSTLLNIEDALSKVFEAEPRSIVVDITTFPRKDSVRSRLVRGGEGSIRGRSRRGQAGRGWPARRNRVDSDCYGCVKL